ncbi:M48 family metalloprotease [Streptomyces antibioticus]
MGVEAGAQIARARALAVLRIRSRALAIALLPAAAAVILLAGGSTGHFVGPGWRVARVVVSVLALVVLLAAGVVALVVARARPAVSPTVAIAEEAAPDLYRLVRDLADRLDVPAPSAIALTPDCDSWLEDRTHPAHGPPAPRSADEIAGAGSGRHLHRRTATAPVLVIGSPFLWWMRVGELRAVLAPVVAGTGPSAQPDIAAARRFVRGLDAAVAASADRGRCPGLRLACAGIGWVARLMLRGCQVHASEMERGVAAAAAERAQAVDYGLRIVAQEQVGLAYAGWDRLLTRVALPAWRMGRWPSRLDAGVVAALTELSRRDRLAEGFASRLGERPACDLLEEPGTVDEATSLLAARLFHGGPAESGPDWSPVDWQEYPDEVVDRKWRTDAARLHRVLDTLGVRRAPDPSAPHSGGPAPDPTIHASVGPTLARVLDHLTPADGAETAAGHPDAYGDPTLTRAAEDRGREHDENVGHEGPSGYPGHEGPAGHPGDEDPASHPGDEDTPAPNPRSATLATHLGVEVAREEAASTPPAVGQKADTPPWDDGALPLFPLQPPRTDRELLTDHVTAMVCCAAMDTVGATPGLDWLDGPTLLVDGVRVADLAPRVLSLVEDGDAAPLRAWLVELGIRPEKPVRLG